MPRLQATLALVATVVLWFWRGGRLAATLAFAAAILALLAWIAPSAHAPFARAFEKFGRAILVIFTWLALAVVYFAVFTPLRLWRSLRRHDPLARRFDPAATTYLRPLPAVPPRFTRPF